MLTCSDGGMFSPWPRSADELEQPPQGEDLPEADEEAEHAEKGAKAPGKGAAGEAGEDQGEDADAGGGPGRQGGAGLGQEDQQGPGRAGETAQQREPAPVSAVAARFVLVLAHGASLGGRPRPC